MTAPPPATAATSPAVGPAARGGKRDTPAMRQHARFKAEHPGCILFFRMGDFYELFDDDAELVHRVLGLTLTQRTEGIPMAGIPYHALDGYLQKLVVDGYRVAICDQVQDPRDAKGVVDRAVTRVITPGTLVDEALLDEARSNQVAAVAITGGPAGAEGVLAVAEVSTGRFTLRSVPVGRLADEVARLAPSELLYAQPDDGSVPAPIERVSAAAGCALTARPAWTFRPRDARELLTEHFGVRNLEGFGLAEDDAEIGPAGALLRYLQETQAPDPAHRAERLGHLRPPRREAEDRLLGIDAVSLRCLEVERTMRTGGTAGSLLSILQRCSTSMGKRLLRHWLCFPLRDLEAIERRQRAVAALIQERDLAEPLAGNVSSVQDVARIVARVSMGRATPRDLVALGRSAARLRDVIELIEGHPAFAPACARLTVLDEDLGGLAADIEARCEPAPPAHLRDGGLFRDGIDAELDEARGLQTDANSWLARYQADLVAETSIASLKVGYNRVFGYYIEVTHTHAEKVPPTFQRKQTLKNAERYVTPELKEFEEKVTTARARAIERENRLFTDLCREAAAHAEALAEFADVIAELDVLACFADVAVRYGYVRPVMVEEPVLEIRQGRHPVLDRLLGERFVPNDCLLGRPGRPGTGADDDENADDADESAGATLALITGPNMAGKSTSIRQAAIITLLAHTGSWVPAEAATIGLTDRIFTRIGAADELHAGQSTFMVEMTETANILHHATDRSLVILDEIGRGTSTLDGLALAWAIAEKIADTRCRALFATHYHELTDLAEQRGNVTNLHVAVREWGEEIVFLYRILPGRTDRSYGIHVAKIAGLPRETIARASEVLESLAVHTEALPPVPAGSSPPDAAAGGQLSLFREYLEHPVIDRLRTMELERMTPIEAFDALRRLVDEARE